MSLASHFLLYLKKDGSEFVYVVLARAKYLGHENRSLAPCREFGDSESILLFRFSTPFFLRTYSQPSKTEHDTCQDRSVNGISLEFVLPRLYCAALWPVRHCVVNLYKPCCCFTDEAEVDCGRATSYRTILESPPVVMQTVGSAFSAWQYVAHHTFAERLLTIHEVK